MAAAKGSRKLRAVEKRKKKSAAAIPRKKVTRIMGATKAARTSLKRAATKARVAKAKTA